MDTVDIAGLRGKGISRWILLPLRLSRAVFQAFSLLGDHRPACAVSFGGYAAGPGGLAARLRGIPLLVHEQNRIPGLTNRVLARLSNKVLEAFPGTWDKRFKALTCGNPVRDSVAVVPEPDLRLAGREGPIHLLITGGSQGARALNDLLPAALSRLPAALLPDVRHQAGRGWLQETTDAYGAAGVTAKVTEFIEDMAEAYEWADLVVCRAGALTVSELAAAGVAAILVPYPHAVDDHQSRNAEFLVEAGAAAIIPQSDCDSGEMTDALARLVTDRLRLLRMARAARSVAIPDAAVKVAAVCMEYAA
jgi:UDP-N-acetylglucosamine--N-acetylmuramyl-(pentapeptide) pyrophosphoryl-undecaprenol N-acetylglucosamine transferase